MMEITQGEHLFAIYTGLSMYPTLSAPDVMEITSYPSNNKSVVIGDVIFFSVPGKHQTVVHRVVGIEPEGFRTRGDNNSKDDPQLVEQAQIYGQVVRAWRGTRCRPIMSGRMGFLFAVWVRRCQHLLLAITKVIRISYDKTGFRLLTQRLPVKQLKVQVVVYQSQGKNISQLHWRHYRIGFYDQHLQRWAIRKPFGWLVDLS